MATKNAQSLWKDLPKDQQEEIRRQLLPQAKRELRSVKPQRPPQFQLKGYVRLEIAQSEKAQAKEWIDSQLDDIYYQTILKLTDSGFLFKVGVGKDSFTASLSAFDTGTDADGYVLTGFGSDARIAIGVLLYKHEILMRGDWLPFLDGYSDDFMR